MIAIDWSSTQLMTNKEDKNGRLIGGVDLTDGILRHGELNAIKCLAWASCQIRKIAGAHAPGMPGTFSPSLQACDPDMHHGTCVTHVP